MNRDSLRSFAADIGLPRDIYRAMSIKTLNRIYLAVNLSLEPEDLANLLCIAVESLKIMSNEPPSFPIHLPDIIEALKNAAEEMSTTGGTSHGEQIDY